MKIFHKPCFDEQCRQFTGGCLGHDVPEQISDFTPHPFPCLDCERWTARIKELESQLEEIRRVVR